jgi:hypothetical protein
MVIEMIDRCLVGLTAQKITFAAELEERKYHIIGKASECVLTVSQRAAILNAAFRAPPSPRAGPSPPDSNSKQQVRSRTSFSPNEADNGHSPKEARYV